MATALNPAAANAVKAALIGTNGAILQNGGGSDEANSHGLSVYVPSPGNYLPAYGSLSLAADAPHWRQFLQAQVQ